MVLAGDIALTAALIAELVFAATYALVAKWWRTSVGLNLMFEALMFLAVLVYLFAAMLIRSNVPNPQTPRVIIYSILAAFTVWRWALLIREQRPRQ